MIKYKVLRCIHADYILNNKYRYAVEYITIDENNYPIDFGIDFDYFDTEEDANEFIKNYNNKQLN